MRKNSLLHQGREIHCNASTHIAFATRHFLPRSVRLTLVLATALVFPLDGLSQTELKPKTVSLGMSRPPGEGDAVDEKMYQLLGQIPDLDHVAQPSSGEELLQTLAGYRSRNIQVSKLVLAFHGSADRPSLMFAKQGSPDTSADLAVGDIDVTSIRDTIARYQAFLANTPMPAETAKKQEGIDRVRNQIRQLEKRAELLDSVAGVMAPKGEVILVNCSAAANDEGKQFVNTLGTLLLGENGGSIRASTSDVTIDQVRSYGDAIGAWIKSGNSVSTGDFFFAGDWVDFDIAAGSYHEKNTLLAERKRFIELWEDWMNAQREWHAIRQQNVPERIVALEKRNATGKAYVEYATGEFWNIPEATSRIMTAARDRIMEAQTGVFAALEGDRFPSEAVDACTATMKRALLEPKDPGLELPGKGEKQAVLDNPAMGFKYWLAAHDNHLCMEGYYHTPQGQKVDYRSMPMDPTDPLSAAAGLFVSPSGKGYYIEEKAPWQPASHSTLNVTVMEGSSITVRGRHDLHQFGYRMGDAMLPFLLKLPTKFGGQTTLTYKVYQRRGDLFDVSGLEERTITFD